MQGMRRLYHPSQQCIFCATEQGQDQWGSEATVKFFLTFLPMKAESGDMSQICFLDGLRRKQPRWSGLGAHSDKREAERITFVQPLEEKMNRRPYSWGSTKKAEPGSSGRCTALRVIALSPCVSWKAFPWPTLPEWCLLPSVGSPAPRSMFPCCSSFPETADLPGVKLSLEQPPSHLACVPGFSSMKKAL